MKVKSNITAGTRADGKPDPLVQKGDWDFEGRRLTTQERAFIFALAEAHHLEIVEDDEPLGEVVPIAPARAAYEKRIASSVKALTPAVATTERRRAKKKRVSRGS